MLKMKVLLSRPLVKINACLIGYGLWIMLTQHQIITTHMHIPVCFYHEQQNTHIIAPESVKITLHGKKRFLQRFDSENSAIHLDASNLQIGKNYITLTKNNLFLPDKINLVNLIPSHIEVDVKKEV